MKENVKNVVVLSSEQTVGISLPERILNAGLLIGEILVLIITSLLAIAEAVYRAFFPIPEKSVENEIVLITGAGRGIGKELALQYAALGATVVCWGVSKDQNEATVAEIARLGYPKAHFYQCDVSDQKSITETAVKVQEQVGDVTILINNAGVGYAKPLFEQTYAEVEHTINVNVVSHFWTIQAFLPAMIKLNHGHIVANCSVGGLVGLRNGASYCASKFAIRGMMQAFHQELRINPFCQIKSTTVYPYFVNTDILKRVFIRFPKLMPVLEAPNVAREIISAQRRDVFEQSVPKYFTAVNKMCRLFPISVGAKIFDFINVCVEE